MIYDSGVSDLISVNSGLIWSDPAKKADCSWATLRIISRSFASSAVFGPDLPENDENVK